MVGTEGVILAVAALAVAIRDEVDSPVGAIPDEVDSRAVVQVAVVQVAAEDFPVAVAVFHAAATAVEVVHHPVGFPAAADSICPTWSLAWIPMETRCSTPTKCRGEPAF